MREAPSEPATLSDYFAMGGDRRQEENDELSGPVTDVPSSDAPIEGVHVPSEINRRL